MTRNREGFRQRLDLVLANPEQTWPRIDPQPWVPSRQYNERDLSSSLKNFFSERENSLSWLDQLVDPNWTNRYEHPDGRTITAADLFASWLACDHLHLRQLARTSLAVCRRDCQSVSNELRWTLERVFRLIRVDSQPSGRNRTSDRTIGVFRNRVFWR
jgi:hypothetical protein